jgi:hypothetical protein
MQLVSANYVRSRKWLLIFDCSCWSSIFCRRTVRKLRKHGGKMVLEKSVSPVRHYNYERLELCSVSAEEGQEQQLKTLISPSICRRHDQELRWTRSALLFFVLSTIFLLVAYMLKLPSDLACARRTSIWYKFVWNHLLPGLRRN